LRTIDTHVATEERVGEKTVTAMYTSKDNLTPLLYSGKKKKKAMNKSKEDRKGGETDE